MIHFLAFAFDIGELAMPLVSGGPGATKAIMILAIMYSTCIKGPSKPNGNTPSVERGGAHIYSGCCGTTAILPRTTYTCHVNP